mgnify:CR=1 FL=1
MSLVNTFGRVGVSPYIYEDDAYTTFFTPHSFAAMSTWSVPFTFTSLVATGSRIDRGTEGMAAWWKIPSAYHGTLDSRHFRPGEAGYRWYHKVQRRANQEIPLLQVSVYNLPRPDLNHIYNQYFPFYIKNNPVSAHTISRSRSTGTSSPGSSPTRRPHDPLSAPGSMR